jgi:type IV secretion system protein VirD4
MTPDANVAVWRRSRKPFHLSSIAKALAFSAAALLTAQYLAACFFLASIHVDLRRASPLTITRYAVYFGARDDIRRRLWVASGAGLGLVILIGAIVFLPKRRSLHGDARYARVGEIARAGLFAKQGLFLGRVGRRYLILGGQQGVLLAAPPRAEKGTAIVVPNLLLWQGSVICLDVKLENWTLTAGFRERLGQACFLFNPLAENGDTACWNPLTYISADPNLRISDVQRIAAILYPDVPGTDPFWSAGARSYFLGVTMYVLETPSLRSTLGEVLRQGMASDTEGFGHHWRRIIEGRQVGRFPLSSPCVRALSEIVDLAPVTASSIRKTFTSRLDLFANPLLDRATAMNDFDLRDLRKKPISIYLGINPGDLHLLQPLLNLFIEQALSLQTRELPEHNPALKLQVLCMLDELAAPGRIPILAQSVAYLPGYNVRLFLVIQAFAQLREIYGQQNAETMMKSLAARIVYAPKDIPEANEISAELGFTTVKARSRSIPALNFSDPKGQRPGSVNVSEQRRPLLLPQELKELGRNREIIFYEGVRPILATKNRYYRDRFFKRRLFPPPRRAIPTGHVRPAPPPPAPPTPIEGMAADTRTDSTLTPTVPPAKSKRARRSRKATVEDIERIDSLTLDDLDIDLSHVQLPDKAEGERFTEREMQMAVRSFLTSLKER